MSWERSEAVDEAVVVPLSEAVGVRMKGKLCRSFGFEVFAIVMFISAFDFGVNCLHHCFPY